VGVDALKSLAKGSMTQSLVVLIGLMVLGLVLCARLWESGLIGVPERL
jgi:hypothetical protein